MHRFSVHLCSIKVSILQREKKKVTIALKQNILLEENKVPKLQRFIKKKRKKNVIVLLKDQQMVDTRCLRGVKHHSWIWEVANS